MFFLPSHLAQSQPHDSRCACNECITSRSTDSLRHSHSRINAYRALASPSLVSYTIPTIFGDIFSIHERLQNSSVHLKLFFWTSFFVRNTPVYALFLFLKHVFIKPSRLICTEWDVGNDQCWYLYISFIAYKIVTALMVVGICITIESRRSSKP